MLKDEDNTSYLTPCAHFARMPSCLPNPVASPPPLPPIVRKWIRKGRLEEWQSAFRRGVIVPTQSPAQVFHAAVAAEYLTAAEPSVDR